MKFFKKHRNNWFVVLLFFSIVSGCSIAGVHRTEAEKIAHRCFDLRIPNGIDPIISEEVSTFTGEGYAYLVIKFDSVQAETFTQKNKFGDFIDLPIKECMPPIPSEMSCYMAPDVYHRCFYNDEKEFVETKGKYLYKTDKSKLYSVVIYDEINRKLLAYRSFYEVVSVDAYNE